jgi:hypothetical protein
MRGIVVLPARAAPLSERAAAFGRWLQDGLDIDGVL